MLHAYFQQVQVDDELHMCLALHISQENSRFLVLLVDEEGDIELPPTLQNCVINGSMVNAQGSSKWTIREHMLELPTCTIDHIYAVVYSHDLDVQKLVSLTEDTPKSSNAVGMKENKFSKAVLLGHVRISTNREHDRDLPQITFEGCQPELAQQSEALKSVSLNLRWGLVQGHVPNGGCRWVQYHVYVTKDEEEPEFLGVAVVQAFSVQELLISSSCNMITFHVQAQCACGLPGQFSSACPVDVSHIHHQRWSSDSDRSQPLLSDDAV